MRISQSKIDEIASSLDIVELISQYTPLRKAGQNFMGRCPFHQEKTPSFSVSQEKGVYHCFGCGKSGNMFNFIMDIDNISFYEAVRVLAEKANIELEFDDKEYEDRNKIDQLYEINKQAAKYFHDTLMSTDGIYAKEYLNHRNIKDETIIRFGLGFSLRLKDSLSRNLLSHYDRKIVTESGLSIETSMSEIRDRFRGRVMYPIFSESARVVGFGARKIFPDDSLEGKYINSPETKIYNKSKILYGLNFARKAIKEYGFALLVEGYMDLISLFQNGFENVIASSGTSLTTLQIRILSRYTNEVVVVFDSDLAGKKASRRSIEIILENNLNVSLISLPGGDDPDSFISRNGRESFEKLVNSRKSIIDYIGETYRQQGKLETPDGKTQFVREVITLISRMRDEIRRDFYIKDIAKKFSIYESIIRKELDNLLKLKSKGLTREVEIQPAEENIQKTAKTELSNPEKILVRLLVDSNDETRMYLFENLEIDYIENKHVINLVDYVFKNLNQPEYLKTQSIINNLQDKEITQLISEIFVEKPHGHKLNIENNEYLRLLAAQTINELELSKLIRELEKIESEYKINYTPEIANNYTSVKNKIELRKKEIQRIYSKIQSTFPEKEK